MQNEHENKHYSQERCKKKYKKAVLYHYNVNVENVSGWKRVYKTFAKNLSGT